MKISVSSRRISRCVVKSIGVLFILALFLLAYNANHLTAFANHAIVRDSNNPAPTSTPGPSPSSTPPN